MEALTDEAVEVPLFDLDVIRAALNAAYYQNTVIDLTEQYRRLSQRSTPSNLTKSLKNALTLVAAYMESTEEPDEQPVPE